MYGWDSYFIIRGLLRENRIDLAKGMVEDFFFEIENYGGVLNANRTYYLTRSQPPFLSSMILAVYEAQGKQGRSDLAWLQRAYAWPFGITSTGIGRHTSPEKRDFRVILTRARALSRKLWAIQATIITALQTIFLPDGRTIPTWSIATAAGPPRPWARDPDFLRASRPKDLAASGCAPPHGPP